MSFALLLSLAATEPCLRQVDAFAPMVVPADGAIDVPVNATPIVSGQFSLAEPALVVNEAPLDVDVAPFEAEDGFGRTQWLRIVPRADLPPGARVSVRFDDVEAASFFVGAERDDAPPPAPTIGRVVPFSGGACTPFLEVQATGDAALLARVDEAPSLDDVVHGIGTNGVVVVAGPASARKGIFVASVDLAGNVGDATSVEATFPPAYTQPLGCASTRADATALACAALLFVSARAARSRPSRRPT